MSRVVELDPGNGVKLNTLLTVSRFGSEGMKKRRDIALLFGGGAASMFFLIWGFIGVDRGTMGELSSGTSGASGGNASMNLIIFGVAGLVGTLMYAVFHDWVQPDAEGRPLSGWEILMFKLSRWFRGDP